MTEPRLHATVDIREEVVRELFASHTLTAVGVTPMSGGIINTNIRVDCTDRPYLLRIYQAERSIDEIEFELSALRRLHDGGIPVQRPVDPVENRPRELEGRLYTILTFIEGEIMDEAEVSPAIGKQMGRFLGDMQNALEGFVPAGQKARCDGDFIDNLVREAVGALHARGEVPLAESITARWQQAREPFLADELPLGLVHADLYPGNVILRNGSVVGVIDFDDAYYGTQFFDVAIAAMEFAFRGDVDLDVEIVRDFVSAYEATQAKIDNNMLLDAMLLNCFRFFAYTLPLTLEADEPAETNVYARRISLFSDSKFRRDMLHRLGRRCP
ncbi:phosphotransferase [Micromonospora sp. WMMD980]|uniref:phosphotransferase n=1 Tax=Micromonospora sp. WMMD980 TaxID=3016088 RepID=UPI002415F929|nr:phosphotransferase [Micromonospora sp. WMMD980]MDG4803225.1 phosphotransferase [Micromonospora sp. WMMD980]